MEAFVIKIKTPAKEIYAALLAIVLSAMNPNFLIGSLIAIYRYINDIGMISWLSLIQLIPTMMYAIPMIFSVFKGENITEYISKFILKHWNNN